ncbi:bifunctional metallophosphatase/5'-nucleotidase [Bauldia sp.]|uniref:bifunctional metallophosphatase/5'-nucleotidase n=1 Tax=Bauldia sp. TaxID=2575872 RepID=UPI003BADA1D1
MKPFVRIVTATALLSLLTAPVLADQVTLTFVHTNDIDRMQEDDGRGGFARLATVVEQEHAEGPTFFVHSGDTISPSLLAGLDKGAHIIDILNNMDVDVMAPGNHEFDFGPEVFRQRIDEANFTILASNLTEADGSPVANTVDTHIVEVEGITVGFYGLTTEDTVTASSPGDIAIAPAVEVGIAKADELRAAGADFVVGVMHTPIDDDLALARAGAGDLILSGHDENLLALYNGRTALVESEAQANFVVVTDIAITKEEEDDGSFDVSWHPAFTIVDTANVEPDPEIAALVKTYTDRLDEELKVEIGSTETPLDSRRASVRTQETAIGNLITDAMRQAVDADIAITNGGGIRADREYEPGTKLTRGDVLAELPFGNKTVKLEMTGAQIRAALENGFSGVETVAGRFPQVSGLTIETNYGRPAGERVLSVMVDGAPLDDAATYTVATNDFLANGGDGYAVFTEAPNLINPVDATLMASQVIDYIAAAGTVSPTVEGRINEL